MSTNNSDDDDLPISPENEQFVLVEVHLSQARTKLIVALHAARRREMGPFYGAVVRRSLDNMRDILGLIDVELPDPPNPADLVDWDAELAELDDDPPNT